MNRRRLGVLLLAALGVSASVGAQQRVPGTWTYFSSSTDPITDVNTSFVLIDEVNDTTGATRLGILCSSGGRQEVWAVLITKNELFNARMVLPDVIMRLGTRPATTLNRGALSSTNVSGRTDYNSLGLSGSPVTDMVAAMNRGEQVTLRLDRDRTVGSQTLTYIFPADGFRQAWTAIRGCAPARASAPVPAPAPPVQTQIPRFTTWVFTRCTDVETGAARTSLRAGVTHRCELVIDTLGGGINPVAAEFRYELEYREGGQTRKLTLDTVDRWNPSSTNIRFRREGNRYIFELPLNVRARAERTYTSLNVTARLVFPDGTSKQVYEPLPVR